MLTVIKGGLHNGTETLQDDESSVGCSCVNLLLVLTSMLIRTMCNACRVCQLEGKVAMLTVINEALQNENETLRHDQSSGGKQSTATDAELHELQEEFTRRIATADRTIASLKVCCFHATAP